MRIGWPGQARLSLVQESPLTRLTRGLPGTTNCCCEHAFQRRLIDRPRRAPPPIREEVSVVELLVTRCAGLDVAKDEVVTRPPEIGPPDMRVLTAQQGQEDSDE